MKTNPFEETRPSVYLKAAELLFKRGPENSTGVCNMVAEVSKELSSDEEHTFVETFSPKGPQDRRHIFWMDYDGDNFLLTIDHAFERRLLALLLCYEMSKEANR